MADVFRRLFDGGSSAQHDEIGEGQLFAAGIELLLDLFEGREDLTELFRIVHRPGTLREETNTRAVGAAPLVGSAERGSRGSPVALLTKSAVLINKVSLV